MRIPRVRPRVSRPRRTQIPEPFATITLLPPRGREASDELSPPPVAFLGDDERAARQTPLTTRGESSPIAMAWGSAR